MTNQTQNALAYMSHAANCLTRDTENVLLPLLQFIDDCICSSRNVIFYLMDGERTEQTAKSMPQMATYQIEAYARNERTSYTCGAYCFAFECLLCAQKPHTKCNGNHCAQALTNDNKKTGNSMRPLFVRINV